MNLDFGADAVFSWYVVLLCLSGVVMVVMAAVKTGEQSTGARALSAVAGVGFLGYGVYLGFIFGGGSYMMFFQAFILPALLVFRFVRSLFDKPEVLQAPQYPVQQPYYGDPTHQQPFQAGPAQQPYAGGAAQPQQEYPVAPPQPGSPQSN